MHAFMLVLTRQPEVRQDTTHANAVGGEQECGAPQLPPQAVFALFQHSEHLTAAASLFYECCATSGTSAAAQTDTLEALAVASALIGAHVDTLYYMCARLVRPEQACTFSSCTT